MGRSISGAPYSHVWDAELRRMVPSRWAALLILAAAASALPVFPDGEGGGGYIPGGAEEEPTMDGLEQRGIEIALDISHSRSSAPVDELGESESESEKESEKEKQPPSAKEMNVVMGDGLKIWKEGEKKNGDESMGKLNNAMGVAEQGALNKAWKKGKGYIEQAAIKAHLKHPKEVAKEGAESMEKGMKMVTKMVGDDTAHVEGEEKAAEKEVPVGTKAEPHGEKVIDEFKESDKLVHQAKQDYDHKAKTAPKRYAKLKAKQAATVEKEAAFANKALEWANAKAKGDKNPAAKAKDQKLAKTVGKDAQLVVSAAKRLDAKAKAAALAAKKPTYDPKKDPREKLNPFDFAVKEMKHIKKKPAKKEQLFAAVHVIPAGGGFCQLRLASKSNRLDPSIGSGRRSEAHGRTGQRG